MNREKVAEALWRVEKMHPPEATWKDRPDQTKAYYFKRADAAIAAMQEEDWFRGCRCYERGITNDPVCREKGCQHPPVADSAARGGRGNTEGLREALEYAKRCLTEGEDKAVRPDTALAAVNRALRLVAASPEEWTPEGKE